MKKYIYKIYSYSGTYLTTWEDASAPVFSYKINSGLSELTVKLARKAIDFGEGFDVKIGNELKLFVSDSESPAGIQIYDGELSKYHVVFGEQDLIEVTFVGYTVELARRIVINSSGETTISYSQQDPSTIIQNVIDLVCNKVSYTADSIDTTGISVSYDVIQNTALEVIQRMTDLIPNDWYWYIDRTNVLHLHQFDDSNPLKLYIGKHINSVDVVKSGESLFNRYYFLGGGSPQIYRKFDRETSQDEYDIRDKREQDERLSSVSTVTNRSLALLEKSDHPQMEVTCTVVDSNIDPKNGVDIESLKPGQAVQLFHPNINYQQSAAYFDEDTSLFDVDYFDNKITDSLGQIMRIEEIHYFGTGATLKLGTKQPQVGESISKNTIQLEIYRGKDSPTAPSN